METTALRDYATEAIKFWEPYRLLYNLALAALVAAYFAIGYPQSKSVISVDFCLGLFLLAVIANVAYCAAYIVDIFAQASGFREVWRRYRKLLFVIGTCSPPSSPASWRWECFQATASHFAEVHVSLVYTAPSKVFQSSPCRSQGKPRPSGAWTGHP